MRNVALLLCLLAASTLSAADNELTDAEKKDGWLLLFDGKTTAGWMNSDRTTPRTPVQDGALNPPQAGYFADTPVAANAKSSSVSYKVNKKKVKAGDILTVQGKVTLPKGVEPQGTEVFLQTYWEQESHVKTTVEDDGFFVLSVRVSSYDDTFTLRTAPTDLYVAGAEQKLPITNTSLPGGR